MPCRTTPCRTLLVAVALLGAAGCCGKPIGDIDITGRAGAAPPTLTYSQLRAKHNARTTRIDQIWATAVVDFEWYDPDGKRHFERGDGSTLICRKPHELALAIGHSLTNTLYWLGSDAERFWVFDENPHSPNYDTAYVGRIADIGRINRRRLPLPLQPHMVIVVLGIADLPPKTDGICLSRRGNIYETHIDLPGAPEGHVGRLSLDGDTFEPIFFQIDNAMGGTVLKARIDKYEPLSIDGVPASQAPRVPTQVTLQIPAQRASARLTLANQTDGKPRKVRDVQFDFELLRDQVHQPVNVIVLEPDPPTHRVSEPKPSP